MNPNETPKMTPAEKLLSLLAAIEAKINEAFKSDTLTLFAMQGFLALVRFVCDDCKTQAALLNIARIALEETKRLGEEDQRKIASLNELLRSREADLRTVRDERDRAKRDLDDVRNRVLSLGQVCGVPSQPMGVHRPFGATPVDLTLREAYYLWLGNQNGMSGKIHAIKEFRDRTGWGLADSKAAVEAYVMPQRVRDAFDQKVKCWGKGSYTMDDKGCNLMLEDLQKSGACLTRNF